MPPSSAHDGLAFHSMQEECFQEFREESVSRVKREEPLQQNLANFRLQDMF